MHTQQHFRKLFTRDQIGERTRKLGSEITSWAEQIWQGTAQDILAIPVLRGGIFFFADLVRAIDCSVEVMPAQSWNYEVGKNWAMNEDVRIDISRVSAQGRSVLLVDDICDSGKTLMALSNAMMKEGAAEVRAAVLIRRKIEQPIANPEYIGFDFTGDDWFVGYGMEDGERYRNLPEIYVIEKR